jgi:hypothetical protein
VKAQFCGSVVPNKDDRQVLPCWQMYFETLLKHTMKMFSQNRRAEPPRHDMRCQLCIFVFLEVSRCEAWNVIPNGFDLGRIRWTDGRLDVFERQIVGGRPNPKEHRATDAERYAKSKLDPAGNRVALQIDISREVTGSVASTRRSRRAEASGTSSARATFSSVHGRTCQPDANARRPHGDAFSGLYQPRGSSDLAIPQQPQCHLFSWLGSDQKASVKLYCAYTAIARISPFLISTASKPYWA